MNGSEPVTFQDTGSAFMAVQQNKSVGMVANTMTITKLVNQSKTEGVALKMIKEPMVFQPIGIGMKKDEPALLAKVNAALYALDKSGEIDKLWAKWLGPNTEYKLTRDEKVTPLAELKFELLP
jgi:polar amino acid transport system substrate-binding protein